MYTCVYVHIYVSLSQCMRNESSMTRDIDGTVSRCDVLNIYLCMNTFKCPCTYTCMSVCIYAQ